MHFSVCSSPPLLPSLSLSLPVSLHAIEHTWLDCFDRSFHFAQYKVIHLNTVINHTRYTHPFASTKSRSLSRSLRSAVPCCLISRKLKNYLHNWTEIIWFDYRNEEDAVNDEDDDDDDDNNALLSWRKMTWITNYVLTMVNIWDVMGLEKTMLHIERNRIRWTNELIPLQPYYVLFSSPDFVAKMSVCVFNTLCCIQRCQWHRLIPRKLTVQPRPIETSLKSWKHRLIIMMKAFFLLSFIQPTQLANWLIRVFMRRMKRTDQIKFIKKRDAIVFISLWDD